ncbi:hypothetical protein JXA56_03935 [Candidatus Micrarchaeota archaeon]|nr:hypothetical protein [Candidatus Micrarchaeota archaeon]
MKQHKDVFDESAKFAECSKIEKALEFSFQASSRLRNLSPKQEDLAALFYRNCIYLSAAYKLIRFGMIDPAGNNLRTVFETIIWQYAYLANDAIYQNFKEAKELEKEKLKGQWSNTRERKLSNLRRKYNFQKMMKQIYSKDIYEKFFFNQYWVLSQKSHVSLFGANFNTPTMEGKTTMDKAPEQIERNLTAVLYLIAENLLCFLNCFPAEGERIIEFVNEINAIIPPALSLAPEGMEFTIKFREVG